MSTQAPAPRRPRISLVTILVVGLVATVAILFALSFLPEAEPGESDVGLGQLVADAAAGKVETILVSGTEAKVTYVAPEGLVPATKVVIVPETVDLPALLRDEGIALSRTDGPEGGPAVNLVFEKSEAGVWSGLLTIIVSFLPMLLLIGFFIFIMRRTQSAGGQAMDFGKSRARLFSTSKVAVSFDDVAGVDEAKQELAEVVEFLQNPGKFAALGAKIPKGVLLLGPPGTGKTLLARAVAGEAGVPFLSISGSEFVEMFVGVGASRVRDLFDQAKKSAPCIVFLDEIDAVGRQRGAGLGGSHDEREQTLNQILVEMDGFEAGTNVIVIAATNRPDILDPALIRPGRFDRKVILDAPDVRGRDAILRVHLRGKPLAPDISVDQLARTTPGFTGADLANLVNEAAILAARRDKRLIDMDDFVEAVDRVLAGPERKSRLMTPRERRIVAYHEGAHTVVGHLMENHDRPQKVTIVSRGVAAGYTRFLPQEEQHFKTPEMFVDQLCTALAGHAAEELVFGSASTGPSNDLEQVSRLARAMVTRWGMSEKLGPLTYGRTEELVFLGREISETRNYSEATATEIDQEVRRLVTDAHERAKQLLIENRALLDKVAGALLEVETLQDPELTRLLESDPNEPWQAPLPPEPELPPPSAAEVAGADRPEAPAWPEAVPGSTT
ncbi:MAG: ATP-dependent zinc metalloprotease FtsH [Chloroflexi bacterium]|nr:ATP-dependent zinc metalloprotease FtsH [Chloroflexota bacterium]PWB45387.1 MAG: cell division protein FtsH [Dehalococcoidia bacterium]